MDKEVKEKKVCRQQVVFCVLVVLYVFVSLLFSLPVHAATSVPDGYHSYVISASMTKDKYKGFNNVNDFPRTYSENTLNYIPDGVYCIVSQKDDYEGQFIRDRPISVLFYSRSEFKMYHDSDGIITEYKSSYNSNSGYYWVYPYMKYSYGDVGQLDGSNANQEIITDFSINHKVFRYSSDDEWKAYAESVLNGEIDTRDDSFGGGSIDNPDFQDAAYAFTGFTANSKMTATWTGTTERTYLKDEEVEEYVRVQYGFAAKDAPDSIKQVDNDSTEYATAAKSLTVNVSDLVPDDDSWFLRYVQVVPCYRQAGLGVWGDFYHGVPCKVYFNEDGSIDKIVRDFPQSSGDYSYKHIFSLDKYSKTIPAPELSSISHNGFTLLNNTNNEYFVDIIVESKFYGVKMEKSAGTWLPTVDTDWIYSSHYYNFADTSQIAINNDVIYFPNLFSANPENDLITDFKNWSSEYPNYSDLPTMSFLKHSTAARTTYNLKFLFDEDSNYTDSEQLRYSSCAESVFYVRYYNKSMVYGPWVRYKYRDGASAKVGDTDYGGAFVDVGQVDTDDDGNVKVDDNGNPVVSDNVSGRQDYGTGETNYGDSSFSFDLSDISKFFDYLKKIFESVLGSLSAFGSVVAACFPFLPEELVNAVIFGICVMMFVGIIKVVKG